MAAPPGPSADTVQQMLQTGDRLHYQHVQRDADAVDYEQFGSSIGHLKYVGAGWAVIVGASIGRSVLDPSKQHLLLSHRLIHARIVAQWCDAAPLPPVCDSRIASPPQKGKSGIAFL